MKVRDVPQDPGACLAGHQKLNYAVGEDGKYTGVPTIGWEAETTATEVSTEATRARIRAAWADARAGRRSPLAYHMAVVQMDEGQMAKETGFWRWRIRRHLRPDVFSALSPALLGRYADAMALSVEVLVRVPDEPDLP